MELAATLRTRFVETIVFEEGLVICFDLTSDPPAGHHKVIPVEQIPDVIERLCIVGSALGGEVRLPQPQL